LRNLETETSVTDGTTINCAENHGTVGAMISQALGVMGDSEIRRGDLLTLGINQWDFRFLHKAIDMLSFDEEASNIHSSGNTNKQYSK
jgi:hypothetical protein